jgi:hypothetical protein
MRLQQESGGREPGRMLLATTLTLATGQWEEVTGRGPFRDASTETASSRESRGDSRRVFMRLDEVRR